MTEFGIVTAVIFARRKAKTPIIFTLASITRDPLHDFPSIKAPVGINTEYVTPSPQGNVTVLALAFGETERFNPRARRRIRNLRFISPL